jgi:hypothetical protein
MSIHGINSQINTIQQPQKSENKAQNTTAVSFGGVFEAVKRSLDGIMVVAEGNRAAEADFKRHKLEVEKQREFKTELEEAHGILDQIAKIMERHSRA